MARAVQCRGADGDRQLVQSTIVKVVGVAADVGAGGAAGDMQLRTGGASGDVIAPTFRSGGASTTTIFDVSFLAGVLSDGLFIDVGTAGTNVVWWIWYEEVRPT